jgi:hypothetical protein
VHQAVKGGQVGARHGAHGDIFARRQADIVAPLALHGRQHCVRTARQFDKDGGGWLHALRAGCKAMFAQQCTIGGRVGQIRLDLEHPRASTVCGGAQQRHQPGGLRRVRPIHQRAARCVGQGDAVRATQQHLRAGDDCAARVAHHDGLRRPAKARFELAPAAQL